LAVTSSPVTTEPRTGRPPTAPPLPTAPPPLPSSPPPLPFSQVSTRGSQLFPIEF
jgi:hypothetical protein